MKTVVDIENWLTYQVWLANEVVMDFKVYEHSGQDDAGPLYHVKGARDGMDLTPDLDKGEALFSGGLKWDGCINVIFDDQENCMPHFCDNPGPKFKRIFDRLYILGAEMMGDKIYYTVPTAQDKSDG